MRILLTALLSLFLFTCIKCNNKKSADTEEKEETKIVQLILDTDLGPDYDDVGAIALLHALADNGEVNILATVSSNQNQWVVPCIEVLNTYFGRPDLPVGAPKNPDSPDMTTWHQNKWTDYLPAHYPHRTKTTADAPDAVKVYRKILSEAADKSITICTIGFFTNLSGLLLSEGDNYSPLSGRELIEKKVKSLVSMAAHFPQGREFNVHIDAPASYIVLNQWPTEIIFSGFEIGKEVLTGLKVIEMNVTNSPVKDAYALCLAEGDFDGRQSWDQTAVLVAVQGYNPYYSVERGKCIVAEDGSNTWEVNENGSHLRLIEKMDVKQVTDIIENYMMHIPK